MLARLFKPKWQSNNPESRKAAISSLDSSKVKDKEILTQLALQDSSVEVRLTALGYLNDPALYLKCSTQDTEPQIRTHAEEKVVQMLVSSKGELSNELHSWLVAHPEQLPKLKESSCAHIQQLLIDKLPEPEVLSKIVLHAANNQLRHQAAEKISCIVTLEQLSREIRGRDKNTYRLLKNRIDQFRQEEKEQEARHQRVLQLSESFRQILKSDWQPQLDARYELLLQEWQSLGDHPEKAEINTLIPQISAHIGALQAKIAEEQAANEQNLAEQKIAQQLLDQLTTLIDRAEYTEFPTTEVIQLLNQSWLQLSTENRQSYHSDFSKSINKAEELTGLGERLSQARSQLDQIEQQLSGKAELSPSQLNKFRKRIDVEKRNLNWPSFLKNSPLADKFNSLSANLDQQAQQLNSRQQELESKFTQALVDLEALLQHGQTKPAEEALQEAEKLSEMLSKGDSKESLQRLKAAQSKLHELQGWQTYAIIPKKEELCEQMEQLIGSSTPPDELAKLIKSLQEEWKQLDQGDSKRFYPLWKRFRQAADQAYQPCDQYFAGQREQRHSNLDKRRAMCDQLEEYLNQVDWQQVDWKAIDQLISHARQEWRQYSPVDRTPGKAVQARFDKLIKGLTDPLHQHQLNIADRKRALIEQAEALSQQPKDQECINTVKGIQAEWKQLGNAPRNTERKLWNQFRVLCNQIFEQFHEQNQAQNVVREQQIAELSEIRIQLEKVQEQPCSVHTLNQRIAKAQELQRAAGSDLPAAALKPFQQALKLALEQQQALKQFDSEEFVHFQRRAFLCSELEKLLLQGSDENSLEQIKSAWNNGENCPEPYREILQNRYQQALELLNSDDNSESLHNYLIEQEHHLRELCIRLEIALGSPSPMEDQVQRMEYQMQRLQQALAQQQQVTDVVTLHHIELEWQATPFNDHFEELHQRFSGQLATLD